jgi:hypothetical protein
MLNRHGMCARPECSSNRPTHRPPTSKPASLANRADAEKGEEICPACEGVVPAKARYCPYCRAPRRASATVAYFNIEHQAPKPPRMPNITVEEEKPPHQSGTRLKDGVPEQDLADTATKR